MKNLAILLPSFEILIKDFVSSLTIIKHLLLSYASFKSNHLFVSHLIQRCKLVFHKFLSISAEIMAPQRNQFTDMSDPLFLHPLDGPSSISLEEKLVGASNYRSWKRSMKIQLASKRKLGCVTGSITLQEDDPVKIE